MTISVVIRCHNQGAFLGEALDSLRAQSRHPDEVVIVDDGSADETAALLRAGIGDGPWRTTILHYERAVGPAGAFNAGAATTTGELLVALDADDRFSPTYLECTEQAILEGLGDLAYGGVRRFGTEAVETAPLPFDVDELMVENYLHVSALFRRSLLDGSPGFRPELDDLGLEDWEFWVGLVEAGARGVAVDGCWLEYRRHEHGARSSFRRRDALMVHLMVRRLHPRTLKRRHLVRWMARSVTRNTRRALG